MNRFIIRFLKRLSNDIGHECVTCQGEFVVEAFSASHALEEAESAFCELRRTDRWDLFADTVEIKLAGAHRRTLQRQRRRLDPRSRPAQDTPGNDA